MLNPKYFVSYVLINPIKNSRYQHILLQPLNEEHMSYDCPRWYEDSRVDYSRCDGLLTPET